MEFRLHCGGKFRGAFALILGIVAAANVTWGQERRRNSVRPTEYRLLYHLVQNAGWVQTYDQILSKVWGYEYRDEPHYVRLYVNYLRQKLEADPSEPKYILTERGVGYRFVDFHRQKS